MPNYRNTRTGPENESIPCTTANFNNSNEGTSKLEGVKAKKKSFIPLPKTANVKSQYSPLSQHNATTVLESKRKQNCGPEGRNYRSVHSSSIPQCFDNAINARVTDVPANIHSEGSLPSLSSSTDASEKSSKILLKWKNNEISIEIGSDGKIITEDAHDQNNVEEVPKPFLVSLALKFTQVAKRTYRYFLCPICSEPFSRPAVIACGHVFCMNCVCSWFESQDNCPCCRYRIVEKDAMSTLIAQELFETGFLLASIFTAGKVASTVDEAVHQSQSIESLDNNKQSAFPYTSILTEFLASRLKAVVQQNFSFREKDARKTSSTVNEGHCFTAAIWLLRHGIQLSNPNEFMNLLKQEAQQGCETSREMFLKRVMTSKLSKRFQYQTSDFTIPQTSLRSYSRAESPGNSGFRYPNLTLRFRPPTTQSLGKILLTALIFVVISLAVHLCDDTQTTDPPTSTLDEFFPFKKINLLVYAVTVFSLATFMHSERLVYWRRRRRGRGHTNANPRYRL